MTVIRVTTLARFIVYPLLLVVVGAALGFAAYPQVVGHKYWLASWAARAIFNPPIYDADKVTRIATERLTKWWRDVPGFTIIDWRDFGEEAREFRVEHLDADGKVVRKLVRVWVRWKLWSQNNGEEIIYQADGPEDIELIEIEVTEPCEHCG